MRANISLGGAYSRIHIHTEEIARIYTRLDVHDEDIAGLAVSTYVRAEASKELAKNIAEVAEGVTELSRRIKSLAVEQAGNDRTFCELISDNAELARRLGELEEKQCNLYANRVFVVNGLAQRINTLAENGEFLAERLLSQKRRIEQLEGLLEREE